MEIRLNFPTAGHLAWARTVPVSRKRKLCLLAYLKLVGYHIILSWSKPVKHLQSTPPPPGRRLTCSLCLRNRFERFPYLPCQFLLKSKAKHYILESSANEAKNSPGCSLSEWDWQEAKLRNLLKRVRSGIWLVEAGSKERHHACRYLIFFKYTLSFIRILLNIVIFSLPILGWKYSCVYVTG